MRRRILALLSDIKTSGEAIQSYVHNATEIEYAGNALVRDAVERRFITIGEALGRLLKEDPGFESKISSPRRIVGFRNVLTHGYQEIEDSTVWEVVTTELPILLEEVRTLIAKETADT